MRVYRIENANGGGPYTTAWKYRDNLKEYHCPYDGCRDGVKRPTIRFALTILPRDFVETAVCGMLSEEAIREWFGDVWELLAEGEFFLAEYDVPDEWVFRHDSMGSNQVLFRKDMADRLWRHAVIALS